MLNERKILRDGEGAVEGKLYYIIFYNTFFKQQSPSPL
jgi:hypothetical protein